MAKVEKKLLFTEIRKSVGNITFRTRKNRVIDISKKKKPHHPNTPAQARNKWKYGYLVQKFNQLTEVEREYYETLAKKDNLTAWNAYVKANFHKKIDEQLISTYCNTLDESNPDTVEIDTDIASLDDEVGYRSFCALKFPTLDIWPNGTFTEALLTVHIEDAAFFDDTLTKLYFYPIISDYDPNAITWDNPPNVDYDIGAYVQGVTDMTIIQLDISEMLNELANKNMTLYGLLFKPIPDNADNISWFDFYTPGSNEPPNIYIKWEW